MDLSGLIFVALAVAWAAYLIPKALKHHDDARRSKSIDKFSSTMRVLARREPINARDARLVVNAVTVAAPVDPRAANNRSARRRRRVLIGLLVLNLAVVGVAAASLITWPYVAIPVALLVAWLVACRLMVKRERSTVASPEVVEDVTPIEVDPPVAEVVDEETSTMDAVPAEPGLWDPVPVTLPTYVNKPTAPRRAIRTIDLDDSGVWTSGRVESDSQLAREAEAAERSERDSAAAPDRAVGS